MPSFTLSTRWFTWVFNTGDTDTLWLIYGSPYLAISPYYHASLRSGFKTLGEASLRSASPWHGHVMAYLRALLPSYLPLVHCPRFARVTVARYYQSRGPAESQGTVGCLLGCLLKTRQNSYRWTSIDTSFGEFWFSLTDFGEFHSPLQILASFHRYKFWRVFLPYRFWRVFIDTTFGEFSSIQVMAKLSLPYRFWRGSLDTSFGEVGFSLTDFGEVWFFLGKCSTSPKLVR